MFSHIVIYWTKPENPAAPDQLVEGALKYLKPIPGAICFHVGKMAASHRPVVDQTYQVALNIVFTDRQALHDYHTHPLHHEFLDKVFKSTCRKVVAYEFA